MDLNDKKSSHWSGGQAWESITDVKDQSPEIDYNSYRESKVEK